MLPKVRTAEKFAPPVSGRALTLRAVLRQRLPIPVTAMICADFQSTLHPVLQWVVGRLESKQENVVPSAARFREFRLLTLDQTRVSGIKPCLTDDADRFDRALIIREAHGGAQAVRRTPMQLHPGLGNDAQRAF